MATGPLEKPASRVTVEAPRLPIRHYGRVRHPMRPTHFYPDEESKDQGATNKILKVSDILGLEPTWLDPKSELLLYPSVFWICQAIGKNTETAKAPVRTSIYPHTYISYLLIRSQLLNIAFKERFRKAVEGNKQEFICKARDKIFSEVVSSSCRS